MTDDIKVVHDNAERFFLWNYERERPQLRQRAGRPERGMAKQFRWIRDRCRDPA